MSMSASSAPGRPMAPAVMSTSPARSSKARSLMVGAMGAERPGCPRESYRSDWVAGEETEGSRAVRLSQAGAPRAPGGSDDVQSRGRASGSRRTLCRLQRRAGALDQTGRNAMSMIWKGDGRDFVGRGELCSASGLGPSGLRLRVGIQNRSTRPLQVAGIFFDVQSSATDLQPAIQAKVGRQKVVRKSSLRAHDRLSEFRLVGRRRCDAAARLHQPGVDGAAEPVRPLEEPGSN